MSLDNQQEPLNKLAEAAANLSKVNVVAVGSAIL